MVDRHPDDKPVLIRNREEYIEYVGSNIGFYLRYRRPPAKEMFERYEKWLEEPQEYPCMLYFESMDTDYGPCGQDFYYYWFYPEDARELLAAKFMGAFDEKPGSDSLTSSR
jgi:hypothetical protein